MNNKWSEDENKILLEYCSKKIKLEEISIALNKRIGEIKYHIGDLAYNDFKNGLSEPQILEKYNLEKRHLSGAISRIHKKESKQISTATNKNEKREKESKKEKNDKREKESKRETKKDNDTIIISLLNEIKSLLKDVLKQN